jgi:L-iditol 2-dehydrogenase
MKQAVLSEPQKVVFRDVPKPEPGPGQVLIQVKRIGICGSDIHAYYGKHPYISCPIVQGHEFAGRITEVGPDVQILNTGDDVTVMPQLVCGQCYPCRHGNYHICNSLKVIGCQADGAAQEFLAVDQGLVIKLPQGMDYDSGAMIEPVAVGAHAVGRLGSVEGRKILVLGAGPIGNLTAQVAAGRGAVSVAIADISTHRLEIAGACGIPQTINLTKEDLAGAVGKTFGPDGADAILECVGVEETVSQAISTARKGTDIVIVGVFAGKPRVDIGLVQDKELRLIGTLMYRVLDYWTAVELVQSGKVKLAPLMTRHFPFDQYPDAYQYIEKNRDQTMKVFIDL